MFFILGSVRSGTTLLRDLLSRHPDLICPQETHFFRWGEPFQATDYDYVNRKSETLIQHRKMDGVSEEDFLNILSDSKDRKEFMNRYMKLFRNVQKNQHARAFDKTPQNVYGLPLIKAYFPDAQIIHIVRNPLNVVASLKQGRDLLPQTLIAAINFWKEAVLIINTMKPLLGDNLYQLKYEDLTSNPETEITGLLSFLNERDIEYSSYIKGIYAARDTYLEVLTENEIATVKNELSDWMAHYGYVV